jgi:hypothetical protein
MKYLARLWLNPPGHPARDNSSNALLLCETQAFLKSPPDDGRLPHESPAIVAIECVMLREYRTLALFQEDGSAILGT